MFRSCTRRSSSLVGMFSRRAASVALSSSVPTPTSIVQAESTAETLDLALDLGEHREVIRVDQDVAAVLQGGQQLQGLLEVELYPIGRSTRHETIPPRRTPLLPWLMGTTAAFVGMVAARSASIFSLSWC